MDAFTSEVDEMEEMVLVTLYCDSTGLYNEDEINKDNLCELMFPKALVEDWYYMSLDDFTEETANELGLEADECTFDMWFEDVYVADDMDGFYQFAVDRGFRAVREEK